MSGVANYYAEHDLGVMCRGRRYAQTMKGLHNYFGLSESVQPKTALTWSQLTTLVDRFDAVPVTFVSARDKCLYLFSFYALLRLRECVSSRLTWDLVRMHEWGMEIVVPYSKTNLRPVSVRIVSRPDAYCPVRAYLAYRALTHPKLRTASLPFFRQEADRSAPLTTDSALSAFKHRLSTELHLSASEFGWHSFRRGGTTALFLSGVSDSLIAIHGRWLSLTYRRYFDSSIHFTLPTSQLLDATLVASPSSAPSASPSIHMSPAPSVSVHPSASTSSAIQHPTASSSLQSISSARINVSAMSCRRR